MDTIRDKMELVKQSGAFAVAMDIDAAGLPFLQNLTPPAGSKSVEQLKEIVKIAEIPFVLKGIMTVRGAEKALEAGVQAIVVSNHGGRVLDQCPSTAEVLPDIVKAVDGQMKVFVDGGIRTGTDVFKALAMGADAVLIARPFVAAAYGAGAEGVRAYIARTGAELERYHGNVRRIFCQGNYKGNALVNRILFVKVSVLTLRSQSDNIFVADT